MSGSALQEPSFENSVQDDEPASLKKSKVKEDSEEPKGHDKPAADEIRTEILEVKY